MAAVAQLSPIAVDASVLVIVGAGLPGGGRPSFTTADLADRPAAVQAAFDAEWGREVGSEALNVLIRANRERALAPERLGAAPVAIATTVTDAVLNTRRRCALPALYLRGHGMGRRCLTCGTRWSPIGIGVTPGECCLVDSRPAIALDDEVPINDAIPAARAIAADSDLIIGVAIEPRDRVVLDQILGNSLAGPPSLLLDRHPADEVVAYFDTVVEGAPIRSLLALFPPATPQ